MSTDTRLPLLHEVEVELYRAVRRFDPFNSPHEGWAVIKEELDELWKHVIENTGRSEKARAEAIQTAAMAIRYAMDLCDAAAPSEDTE
jgi:hypothetical protein